MSLCLKKDTQVHSLYATNICSLSSPNIKKECSHGFDDASVIQLCDT